MKKLTVKQIQQVKSLNAWSRTNFHGNTKKIGELAIDDLKKIVSKKIKRELSKIYTGKKSEIQIVRSLINQSLKSKGTNYFKIMIEGNTGIYLASPVYLHSDYNKCRLFDKNEKTLKLMHLFNKIVNK